MLAAEIAQNWLSGRWLPALYPSPVTAPGNAMVDIFGQAIVVGSMVKLIGKVTAINPSDPHFQDITFTPLFPQSGLVAPESGVFPQNIPVKVYQAHPLQLVVGGTSL